MSILDNEGHDPNGLGNRRVSLDVQANIAALNGRIVQQNTAIERLRAALKAIADDLDTNVEAAVYARNALAVDEQNQPGKTDAG